MSNNDDGAIAAAVLAAMLERCCKRQAADASSKTLQRQEAALGAGSLQYCTDSLQAVDLQGWQAGADSLLQQEAERLCIDLTCIDVPKADGANDIGFEVSALRRLELIANL